MTIRDSVKSRQPTEVERPKPQQPSPRGTRHLKAKHLLAPLLGLSLVLHGLVLFAPVPSRPESAVEDAPATEEEFVDLLSISSLPEAEPEPVEPPPAAETVAPPPQAAAPTAPTQPVVPEVYPSAPPPAADLAEPSPPAEDAFTATPPTEEPAAFVAETEVVEILTRLTRGSGESNFDSTETSFPAIAYLTRGGIGEWPPAEQSCFFTQISDADFRLPPNAASLRYLTRNVQLIETEDIPRTFPPPQFQVSRVEGGYCNRPLYQVLRESQPYVFVSVVGIGVGAPGQQASGLVIIWANDPRVR